MIIFQIDRVDLSGRKNTTKTQFPLKLDRQCQILAGCGNKGSEYELQSVSVHQGNSEKGHCITFLKPAGGPHWALFDDHNVQWVQEERVLTQEATILVYARPDDIAENRTIIIPDNEREERSSPLEMGTVRNSHSGQATVTIGDLQETVDNTLRPPAPSNPPETGNHPLYRELLERAHQDPTTQECDLEETMTGQPNNERQMQEDVKRVQEL